MTKEKLTLADAGKLIASHTSDNMREKVLSFIVEYQDNHNGQTPNVDLIARSLGTVDQAVRAILHRLEAANKIHCISRNPLRVIVMQRDTILPHEQGSVTAIADPARFNRLLEADGARHGLCRWINQHNAAFGRGPTLKEMMNYLGITNGAWVNRAVEIMAERGLVKYGQGQNTELTEQGLMFYRLRPPAPTAPQAEEEKIMPEVHQDKPQRSSEPPKVIIYRNGTSPPPPSAVRNAKTIGEFLYDYPDRHGGLNPEHKELVAAIGAVSAGPVVAALAYMEAHGWIEPRVKAQKRNVRLTEAGRAKFGPQDNDMNEPDPEPGAEPAKAPRVERVSMPWYKGAPVERVPEAPVGNSLSNVATSDLIMELIERGYVVRK